MIGSMPGRLLSTRRGVGSADVVVLVLALVVAIEVLAPRLWTMPGLRRWATVLVAICLQATPFVLLGGVLSALIAAAPNSWTGRWMPRRPILAVPAFGLAGAALPGCECGSVPAAASLMARGASPGAATAFMVSAPSTNPVVLAATATAFPGQPMVVAARFVAGLVVATCVGWLASSGLMGRPTLADPHSGHPADGSRVRRLLAATVEDMLRSLGLLSAGAGAAAAIVVWFPRDILTGVARQPALGVLALAVLAIVLSMCSQADAFIARSFVGFSGTAQLAFMVVGPAVDVKLAAMQAGAFGVRFTARFSAVAFLTAVVVASVVSAVML
jgi:uncharacterized membrane protein YraQ (UPF0718 family)